MRIVDKKSGDFPSKYLAGIPLIIYFIEIPLTKKKRGSKINKSFARLFPTTHISESTIATMKPTSLVEGFKQDKIDTDALIKKLVNVPTLTRQLNPPPSNQTHSTIENARGKINNLQSFHFDSSAPLFISNSNTHNGATPTINKLKQRFNKTPVLGAFLSWVYKVFALPSRFYRLQLDFSNRAAWIDHYGNYVIQATQNHNHQGIAFEKSLANTINELQALRNQVLAQAYKIERLETEAAIQTNGNRTLKTQMQGQMTKIELLKRRLNALAPLNRHLTELNEQVTRSTKILDQNVEKTGEIEQVLSNKLTELFTIGNQLEALVATLQSNQETAAHTIHHASSLAHNTAHKVHNESDEIRIRLLRLERALKNTTQSDTLERTKNLQRASIEMLTGLAETGKVAAKTVESIIETDFDYFMFTHKFRGSTDEIKRRQSVYLEYFEGRQNVIDLGCGRGEFLSLLAENGISACGIDISKDNIDYCLEFGLKAKQCDLFDYLNSIPNESLDGIFSAQVIEHLTPTEIIQLVTLCNLKLKKDGVLILESVNTNCLQAFIDFYIDPTHIRPVPPDFMQYLLQSKMFKVKPIKFSAPISADLAPTHNADSGAFVNSYVDYAVIGYKA